MVIACWSHLWPPMPASDLVGVAFPGATPLWVGLSSSMGACGAQCVTVRSSLSTKPASYVPSWGSILHPKYTETICEYFYPIASVSVCECAVCECAVCVCCV